MALAKTNLHIYQSPLTHESRILKETKSITDWGLVDNILVAAIWEEGLAKYEEIDDRRIIHRIAGGKLPTYLGKVARGFNLLIWMYRIVRKFISVEIEIVSCRSLIVLPLGVFFKFIKGTRIIYDVHELETEKDGWGRGSQILGKLLEKVLFRWVDSVVVVSPSIASWYKKNYAFKDVHVIRNVSYRAVQLRYDSNIFRKKFNIPADKVIFIFQGSFSYGRGVKLLLEIFSEVSDSKHIVFMGYGDLLDEVRAHSEKYNNIHYQPAVTPEEIPLYTSSADVGFNIAEPSCVNHLYSLPNKIFEYIGCGVSIIVSDFPDMGKLVDDHDCGWKVSVDKTSISKLIESIDINNAKKKKENTRTCGEHFDWNKEALILKPIYAELLK